MTLNLRLRPVDYLSVGHDGKVTGFAHTLLQVMPMSSNVQRTLMSRAVMSLEVTLLPVKHAITGWNARKDPFDPLMGRDYGVFDRDCFENPYTWVAARELARVLADYPCPAVAYLNALPPDTLVILDWH